MFCKECNVYLESEGCCTVSLCEECFDKVELAEVRFTRPMSVTEFNTIHIQDYDRFSSGEVKAINEFNHLHNSIRIQLMNCFVKELNS